MSPLPTHRPPYVQGVGDMSGDIRTCHGPTIPRPGSPGCGANLTARMLRGECWLRITYFRVSGDLFLPDEHTGPDGVHRDERLAHPGEVLEVTIVNVIGFLLCFPRLRFLTISELE